MPVDGPVPVVGAAASGEPPELPPLDPPSSTLLGCELGARFIGIGIGRLSADLPSCSADIAWYMSKPMKLIAL